MNHQSYAYCFFLFVAFTSSGCRRNVEKPSPSSQTQSMPFLILPKEQPSSEPIWLNARNGDPLELARLANEVGASTLTEVITDMQTHEQDRQIAIRALAFVDEPTIALDVLCDRTTHTSAENSLLALQALATLTFRKTFTEEYDPTAWRRCGEYLVTTLKTTKDEVRYKLIIQALLGLVERGAIEPSKVPAM